MSRTRNIFSRVRSDALVASSVAPSKASIRDAFVSDAVHRHLVDYRKVGTFQKVLRFIPIDEDALRLLALELAGSARARLSKSLFRLAPNPQRVMA